MMSMMMIMMPIKAATKILMLVLVLLAVSLLLDAAATTSSSGSSSSSSSIGEEAHINMNKGGIDVTDGKKPVPAIVTFPMKEYVSFSKTFRCRHELMEVGKGHSPSCLVSENKCGRRIIDGVFDPPAIQSLLEIAKNGMKQRSSIGGPTILDINTGYIRDSLGLENLFAKSNDIYKAEDFSTYASIVEKLKERLEREFEVSNMYFTAPTFITRLDASVAWEPQSPHDEYWHVHADMNNTAHYHYSGLLYMSNYGTDFKGGRLVFTRPDDELNLNAIEEIVEPKKGRIVLFTSGAENPHYVERVTSGQRHVLAFWFTCDPNRHFQLFLDGKQHLAFAHRIRESERRKRSSDELEDNDGTGTGTDDGSSSPSSTGNDEDSGSVSDKNDKKATRDGSSSSSSSSGGGTRRQKRSFSSSSSKRGSAAKESFPEPPKVKIPKSSREL